MVIEKVRDEKSNSDITQIVIKKFQVLKNHYIYAKDVADALLFLLNYHLSKFKPDDTGAKFSEIPNIVGKNEINNLELAEFI